ncbi:MAG: FRG domain-containing protein [Cyanobacteriota bacterium]
MSPETNTTYTQDRVRSMLTERDNDIPEFVASSLGEYCEITNLIRQQWKYRVNQRQRANVLLKGYVGEILPWFRGLKNSSFSLTPVLAREWVNYNRINKNTDSRNIEYKSIYDLEDYYFDRFTRFGRPFIEGSMPMDEIEWNYIMRHHEIPSRLLDWTKGSLIALSYAVRHSLPNSKSMHPDTTSHHQGPEIDKTLDDAAVWMLEPRRLMELTTQYLKESAGTRNIASRENEVRAMRRDFFADPKKECSDEKLTNRDKGPWDQPGYWDYPLPLIPSHISARVESHLSRFTLHSLNSFRMESSNDMPDEDDSLFKFARDAFDDEKQKKMDDGFWYLVKIRLPGPRLRSIARTLRMTGVGDMNFTQDLDGLARELKMRAFLGYQDDCESEISQP